MNAIEIKGLTKSYKDFTLRDINLTLPEGTIMGLVGENGAGKSTTIKLIMNALSRDSGTVSVLGVDNRDASFREVKEDIGVVLDEAYFPEVLTAKNVGEVMKNTYGSWREQSYNNYQQKLALPVDKQFKDFSRGMKMKLAIAVALSHSPRLLLLDEATSHLDMSHRLEIIQLIRRINADRQITVVMIVHDLNLAAEFFPRIAVLADGRIAADGTPGEVLRAPLLRRVYGCDVTVQQDSAANCLRVFPRAPGRQEAPHVPQP